MKTVIKKETFTRIYPTKKNKKGRKITFETVVNCSADKIWKLYESPNEWLKNLSPQAKLVPKSDANVPEVWDVNKYYTYTLLMYGFIPFGKHHLSFENIDKESLMMQSREHGFMVPHWDNYFEVIPLSDASCRIKDVLTIQTNGIDPIVAFYAIGVFKSKHKKISKMF